jgi:hypothetical protein
LGAGLGEQRAEAWLDQVGGSIDDRFERQVRLSGGSPVSEELAGAADGVSDRFDAAAVDVRAELLCEIGEQAA